MSFQRIQTPICLVNRECQMKWEYFLSKGNLIWSNWVLWQSSLLPVTVAMCTGRIDGRYRNYIRENVINVCLWLVPLSCSQTWTMIWFNVVWNVRCVFVQCTFGEHSQLHFRILMNLYEWLLMVESTDIANEEGGENQATFFINKSFLSLLSNSILDSLIEVSFRFVRENNSPSFDSNISISLSILEHSIY